MNNIVKCFVEYVLKEMPKHNKELAQDAAQKRFNLTKDGKVYYHSTFAVRFSYSSKGSFSNTVLSLSTLQKYDHLPFFVVLIRGNGDNIIYIANTTFLKKISHSSHELRIDNIRGSFNGSDISRVYDSLSNEPSCFEELFAIHEGFTWEENLIRLVEATGNIIPNKMKFSPNDEERQHILSSPIRAKNFVSSANLGELQRDLTQRVELNRNAIIVASKIENTNVRAAIIEYLISRDQDVAINSAELEKLLPVYDLKHGLGDYVRRFEDANTNTYTDIKTKLLHLSSNPKGYNIDTFLEAMVENDSVLMFYLIGIDKEGIVDCKLCSVYDWQMINATRFQTAWAGRASRGVTQFMGKSIESIIRQENFQNNIVVDKAQDFLKELLAR